MRRRVLINDAFPFEIGTEIVELPRAQRDKRQKGEKREVGDPRVGRLYFQRKEWGLRTGAKEPRSIPLVSRKRVSRRLR
jgi:hypothetical protein